MCEKERAWSQTEKKRDSSSYQHTPHCHWKVSVGKVVWKCHVFIYKLETLVSFAWRGWREREKLDDICRKMERKQKISTRCLLVCVPIACRCRVLMGKLNSFAGIWEEREERRENCSGGDAMTHLHEDPSSRPTCRLAVGKNAASIAEMRMFVSSDSPPLPPDRSRTGFHCSKRAAASRERNKRKCVRRRRSRARVWRKWW